MIVVIMSLIFGSVSLLIYALGPMFFEKSVAVSQKRKQLFLGKAEQSLVKGDIKRASKVYTFSPLGMAIAGYLFFPPDIRFLGVVVGGVIGFLVPNIYVRMLISKRKKKFDDQLIDSLMIMSSSLRGGLSLIQSVEAVVEEMPAPISQEFGAVLAENKMGVSLEEALSHQYDRMPSPSLQGVITAILLARETGGNLPQIFSRIVGTIRERKKIQENLKTLSLQGKIQGVVMSLLPIAFGVMVYSTNRNYFDIMLTSDIGRVLLIYSATSEVIGAFFIWKISRFTDF